MVSFTSTRPQETGRLIAQRHSQVHINLGSSSTKWNADKKAFIQEWWTRKSPIAPEHKAGALKVCATIDKASMRRLEIDNAWPTQFTEKEKEAWKKENEAWKKREIDRAYGVFIETHFNNSEKKALKENLAACLPVPVTQTKTVWIKRNTNWFSPSMWYRKLASMWYKSPTVVRKVVSTVSMWSSSPNGPYTIGPHDTIRPEGLIGWKVELTGEQATLINRVKKKCIKYLDRCSWKLVGSGHNRFLVWSGPYSFQPRRRRLMCRSRSADMLARFERQKAKMLE